MYLMVLLLSLEAPLAGALNFGEITIYNASGAFSHILYPAKYA